MSETGSGTSASAQLPSGSRRNLDAILAELRTLHALQADTQAQLRSVRRAQLEAASHEASLLAALDGRGRKIDRVLDEYSQAMNERGKALT